MADWNVLRDEARTIVAGAESEDVTLRVVGSAGIRLHCAPPDEAMHRLNRPAKDIDFIVPKEHRKGMRRYLESRGYLVDRDLLVAMEGQRYSFSHPDRPIEIDVFVEKLEFNHVIEVRDRLRCHPVTIALEVLLLQKLQIVNQTATDLLDMTVLLATHEVAEHDPTAEQLDAAYIAGLLGRDWGFHHTAVRNLQRVRDGLASSEAGGVDLGEELNARVDARAALLLARIEARPKSMSWKMRAKVGERVQWWEDVDDRVATY